MLKFLSSARITVIGLFLLFVLTFWGTIAQVQQGLYSTQDRFFNSFFFLAAGFIPFPGAQLVLWILFINLIAITIVRFIKYRCWSFVGILVIHLGLLLYFVAAFLIFSVSHESYIRLAEGQTTNFSTSYTAWELAYWTKEGEQREITAVDTKNFRETFQVPFSSQEFHLTVKKFYSNCEAFGGDSSQKNTKIINASRISLLTPKPLHKERENNVAGGIFRLKFEGKTHTLILYGNELNPTPVKINGRTHYFILRHKHYPLPFTVRLEQFKVDFYPGMNMAKNYESTVTLMAGDLQRQVKIYMNNPLRYKDYALYQSGYDKDEAGRQYSTLAVVKNFARTLPYIACLIVFLGLALHFLIRAFSGKRKNEKDIHFDI